MIEQLIESLGKKYDLEDASSDTIGSMMLMGSYMAGFQNPEVHKHDDDYFLTHHDGDVMEIHHFNSSKDLGTFDGTSPNFKFATIAKNIGTEHLNKGGKLRIVYPSHYESYPKIIERVAKRFGASMTYTEADQSKYMSPYPLKAIELVK